MFGGSKNVVYALGDEEASDGCEGPLERSWGHAMLPLLSFSVRHLSYSWLDLTHSPHHVKFVPERWQWRPGFRSSKNVGGERGQSISDGKDGFNSLTMSCIFIEWKVEREWLRCQSQFSPRNSLVFLHYRRRRPSIALPSSCQIIPIFAERVFLLPLDDQLTKWQIPGMFPRSAITDPRPRI